MRTLRKIRLGAMLGLVWIYLGASASATESPPGPQPTEDPLVQRLKEIDASSLREALKVMEQAKTEPPTDGRIEQLAALARSAYLSPDVRATAMRLLGYYKSETNIDTLLLCFNFSVPAQTAASMPTARIEAFGLSPAQEALIQIGRPVEPRLLAWAATLDPGLKAVSERTSIFNILFEIENRDQESAEAVVRQAIKAESDPKRRASLQALYESFPARLPVGSTKQSSDRPRLPSTAPLSSRPAAPCPMSALSVTASPGAATGGWSSSTLAIASAAGLLLGFALAALIARLRRRAAAKR